MEIRVSGMGKRDSVPGSLGLIVISTIPTVHDLAVLRNSTIYGPPLQSKTISCKVASSLTKYYLTAHDVSESSIGHFLFYKDSNIWASAHCLTSYTVTAAP